MFLIHKISFLLPIFTLLFVLVISLVFVRFCGDYYPTSHNKFVVLDGLRGYLATAVFVHHSVIWYFYLKTNEWIAPQSNLFNNLGQASVVLFFMITAFLFFNKLLDATEHKDQDKKQINWKKLYISRILRIFPLYIFSALIVILISLIITDFVITDSASKIATNILKFLQFKTPNFNNAGSSLINAGVTWTLSFERSFYLALPCLAFVLGLKVRWWWFLIMLSIVFQPFVLDYNEVSLSFLGGIAAAYLVRKKSLMEFFSQKIIGLFALIILIFELNYFHSSYKILAMLLLFVFFMTVVANNKLLLGFFKTKASHFLGTISYSIYLLHGIVLFIVFRFIIGFETAKTFSFEEHFLIVGLSSIILVLASSITYHFIEYPFLKIGKSSYAK